MNNFRSRQSGLTTISWIFVFGLIGFIALLAIRLTPPYLEYFSVKGVFDSLQSEVGLKSEPVSEVKKSFSRRLDINDVRSVTDKDLKIEKRGDKTTISVDYEVRVPIFGNISAVVRFTREADLR